jgi:hypothetical protein
MKKKVLVLGAVSCVAGIVTASAAGCSSTTETTTNTPDTGVDAKRDVSPLDSGDDDAGTCLAPDKAPKDPSELDANPGWKPALAPDAKCTSEELTTFEKNLNDQNLKSWKDLGTSLSDACAACIITPDTATNWGPVVYTASDDGNTGFYNFGACFGALDPSDACGKAVQYLEFCLDSACTDCTAQTDRDQCIKDASADGGPCKSFTDTTNSTCKKLSANSTKCDNVAGAAKALCGGTITDGGDGG